jgi:CHAT domain-containing protein
VTSDPLDIEALASAVEDLSSADEFDRLVRACPELIGREMEAHLEEVGRVPNFAGALEPFLNLVRSSRDDPVAGWEAFQRHLGEMERQAEQMQAGHAEVEALIEAGRFDDAIPKAEELLEMAIESGLGLVVGMLHEQLGAAYRERAEGDPVENREASIAHFEAAIPTSVDDAQRAHRLMNLAVAVGSRLRGDPAENLELSIRILRDALASLGSDGPPALRPTIEMNLARSLEIRERGERRANLAEARELCLSSLEWRSLERGAEDWAYSQINLAAIEGARMRLGEATRADVETPLQAVIAARDRVTPRWLIGAALASLGALYRAEAERQAEQDDRHLIGPGDPDPLPPGPEEQDLLDRARAALGAAIELFDQPNDADRRGRALVDLAAVELAAGDKAGATARYRDTLALLHATAAPRQCAEAGAALGGLLAARGEWEEAAAAYSVALSAAEFVFHARLETPDRQAETRRAGNLARWTAYALARTGDAKAAALVLENSRTRELRRRLGIGADEETFSRLPPEAQTDFREALDELASASLGSGSNAAGRALQEVLTGIRELPGFADFATGSSWDELGAAAAADSPLVYVNPAPAGTLILAIRRQGGEAVVEARFVEVTSHDIVMTVGLAGMHVSSELATYLAGPGETDESAAAFRRGVDYVIGRLGESLAKPIAEYLREVGVQRAALVLCGPLAAAPLHAATWDGEGERRCLLDEVVVSYVPSALLRRVSLERVAERAEREPRLLALGNPDVGAPRWDLPGAGAEVDEIAELFASERTSVATRSAASARVLIDRVEGVTHLHLACHGRGARFDPSDAAIWLSDGWLSALDLKARLESSVCVISACEAGLSDVFHLPDEAISLSTAFLAAGSASVVATLWPIDDLATAILMTRFYEELGGGADAPAALRRAQLWLRDLTEDQETAFLEAHPALAARFASRAAAHRPGSRAPTATPGALRPYRHPEIWAPFVAVGA